MAAIWGNKGTGWELLAPVGFPDEATLHTLIEEAPQLRPLSSKPGRVILGIFAQRPVKV